VLGGVLAVVVCLLFLAMAGWYCADLARPDVIETGSLEWRLLHYMHIGWHRKECADLAKEWRDAVVGVGEQLKAIHLKDGVRDHLKEIDFKQVGNYMKHRMHK